MERTITTKTSRAAKSVTVLSKKDVVRTSEPTAVTISEPKYPAVKTLLELLQIMRDTSTGNFADDIARMKSLVLKSITVGYNGETRIILTTNYEVTSLTRPIEHECKGVILSYPDFNVLVMPPRVFDIGLNFAHLAKHFSEYSIYKINDGTVITLYWFNEKWCIATSRGIDMGDRIWIGNSTYMELFLDAANKTKFSLDKLDRTIAYTFGFRHCNQHPLADALTPTVWFIHATRDGVILCNGTCECDINNMCIDMKISGQFALNPESLSGETDVQRVANLRAINDGALETYLKTGQANYGYICRRKNSFGDIILRSSLLDQLRNIVYSFPRPTDHFSISPTNRIEYCALKCYVSIAYKDLFVQLLPQFNYYYDKFDTLITTLKNRILAKLRGRAIKSGAQLPQYASEYIDKLVDIFVEHINASPGKIDAVHQNAIKVIHDFIVDPDHLNLLFASFSKLKIVD